jgi:hypothetical protein
MSSATPARLLARRGFSSLSPTFSALTPRDDVVWALLKSQRLLAGTRDAALPAPRALVVGPGAAALAARMAALEPSLRAEGEHVAAGSGSGAAAAGGGGGGLLALLARLGGARLDCVVVAQPLHALASRAELAALLGGALDATRGANAGLAVLWSRAAPPGAPGTRQQRWVGAFAAAARAELEAPGGGGGGGGGGSVVGDALAPLRAGQSPMEWVDAALDLAAPPLGLRAARHRKFVERLRGAAPAELLESLALAHDLGRPGGAREARALEAGRRAAANELALQLQRAAARAAAGGRSGGGGNGSEAVDDDDAMPHLDLDVHLFSSAMPPPPPIAGPGAKARVQ